MQLYLSDEDRIADAVQNIRIFGLDGTFKGHLVRPPCNDQKHLHPDQAVQSPVSESKPALDVSRGVASTIFLSNLLQCLINLIIKEAFAVLGFSPNIQAVYSKGCQNLGW